MDINIPQNISVVLFASAYLLEKNILIKYLEILKQYININIYVLLLGWKINVDIKKFFDNDIYSNVKFIETSSNLNENDMWYLTQEIRSGLIECPWGPDRKTFTEKNRPNYAVFNSIIDNKLIGDERNFVRIKDIKSKEYKNAILAEPNHVYEVIIYYHNNSSKYVCKKSIGIADGVMVTSNFPSIINCDEVLTINAQITSHDCNPPTIWGGCYILSKLKCKITYVEGTALIENKGKLNGQSIGPAYLFSTGSLLGFNKISGLLPGGYEYAGFIKYKLKVEETKN